MRGVSWLALVLSLIVFRLPGIPMATGSAYLPEGNEPAVLTDVPMIDTPITPTTTPSPVPSPSVSPSPPPSPAPSPAATPDPEPHHDQEPEDLPPPDIPLLVGPHHPLPDGYIPDNLITAIPGLAHRLTQEAADALRLLMAAAAEDGIQGLRLISAYRSYHTQAGLYANRVAALRSTHGDRAEEAAARVVARPGTSEHQTGLSADISTSWSLHTSFGSTPAGIWLAQNAWRYGYILRYPQGKTAVTGVMYEPWHFRYVGTDHAAAMFELGITLEEYVGWLQDETAPEETP